MSCLNASGQSALDIANFWNHKETASKISQHEGETLYQPVQNYYSQNPLYRASDMRKDEKVLQEAKENPSTKFILFSKQKPFLVKSDENPKKFK